MTAARRLVTVTLGHAKPLRMPAPPRTFIVYERDTSGHGYGGSEVGQIEHTDATLAARDWCKANGYGGKRRHDFYAREKLSREEAEEDAREARFDAIGDQIDEERDAQRWERDEDEMADR